MEIEDREENRFESMAYNSGRNGDLSFCKGLSGLLACKKKASRMATGSVDLDPVQDRRHELTQTLGS